jgi:hypothetical protein
MAASVPEIMDTNSHSIVSCAAIGMACAENTIPPLLFTELLLSNVCCTVAYFTVVA